MTGDDFLDRARRDGALVSGKRVQDDFSQGWGHHPFMRGMKAHHWTSGEVIEGTRSLRSACGRYTVATQQVPLLGPGNLPYCARCENLLMAQARRR